MTKRFNRDAFVKFILQVVEARGLTREQAEKQAGVYTPVITKMATYGASCHAATLLALCDWANCDPMTFFTEPGGPSCSD